MSARLFHRSVDALAVWTEDRVRRAPEPCRLEPPGPLRCFEPLAPPLADPPRTGLYAIPSPRPLVEGDRTSIRATACVGARRGTALLVPPWKIASAGLVSGYTGLLARAGWDVWLVCPPHHLERTSPGARSGEGFVSLDLPRLASVFEQFVVELRSWILLASRRGPVGLLGLSLGALAGALAATAPERLDFAALVAPPHLPTVLAETGIGRRYRRLAGLAGSPWPESAQLSSALAFLDPAARAPTAGRLFVAGALFDAIASPAGALRVAAAWGTEPRMYRRGHLSLLFLCRRLRRDLAAFAADARN